MLFGLAGPPVFAGVVGGPAYLRAPSFGFVIGFIPAAYVAGGYAERSWDRKPVRAFVGFVAASVIRFLVGVPYTALILATVFEEPMPLAALDAGVWPFVIPGLVKAAAAALILAGAWLLARAADRSRRG